MATGTPESARDLADAPLTFDPTEFQGIVADAFGGRLAKLNGSVTITADVLDELKEVATEAIEEAQKLDAAEKALDDAYAADQSDKATYDKGVQEAKDALEAAQTEYDRREKELLAKLADILAKILGIGGDGSPTKDSEWDDDQDPTKPKSKEGSPSDSPSSDKPSDNPSSDSPSSPGQTKLSSDTNPTQQQAQQQQAYPSVTPQQQQQPSAGMSPSMGMPQSQASPSSGLRSPFSRDRDKRKDSSIDTDRDVLPVATPVPAAVPIDRGSSGSGITTRDVSGKPSTSLSTAGQVPGGANTATPRGGIGGGGGMVGAPPPIGGGNKASTSRNGKNFDLDRLLSKPDDNTSVNSGTLSKDSLAASEKAEETEQDRVQKAMRDSVKRMMTDKKAG